jgi:hypothetical protein
MKNNKKTTIIIIIVALLLIGFYIKMADFSSPKIDDDKFYKKITELELKIDSLNYQKDSIRTVIDSTHIKIVTNEKHYQERVNTIITQPDSFSESFTRQYILEYAANHGYHILGASEIE